MTYRVTLKQFIKTLPQIDDDLRIGLVRGLRASGHALKRGIAEQIMSDKVFDRGELHASIAYEPLIDGSSVTAQAPHAAVVEYGSRPHWPPIGPLKDWCRRHGMDEGVAYAIARKISKHGTRPRHYFQLGFERAIDQMAEDILLEVDKVKHGHIASEAAVRRRLREALVSASRSRKKK